MEKTRLSIVLFLSLLTLPACDRANAKSPKGSKTTKAATVKNAVKESALTILTITSQAEARLGVKTKFVENKKIQRLQNFGGQTAAPPDAEVMITAPISGRVKLIADPLLQDMKSGDLLYQLYPSIQPEQFINRPSEEVQWSDALASVKASLNEIAAQITAAKITLARAETLQKNRVGSIRALEDAKAALALIQAREQTALARLKVLKRGLGQQAILFSKTPLSIQAPLSGTITKKHVRDGQLVSAGSPLFTVLDSKKLWVQIPVYVGEMDQFDLTPPLSLRESERASKIYKIARIQGLPLANANANTVTLFFELDNKTKTFRPNQRVWIELPVKEQALYQTIPYSAILYDMNGGSWVYHKTKSNTYVRRRVEVLFKHKDLAVLGRGLRPGMEIVVVAAPELFGSEFWYR
ncbi:MAG: efflux RND transporter periplasmic adaptor subunit [Planctomycetota bacterium]|nr:efflux RND transporter periplasmic adaptor subunit [Planctomycetota bacterium]